MFCNHPSSLIFLKSFFLCNGCVFFFYSHTCTLNSKRNLGISVVRIVGVHKHVAVLSVSVFAGFDKVLNDILYFFYL